MGLCHFRKKIKIKCPKWGLYTSPLEFSSFPLFSPTSCPRPLCIFWQSSGKEFWHHPISHSQTFQPIFLFYSLYFPPYLSLNTLSLLSLSLINGGLLQPCQRQLNDIHVSTKKAQRTPKTGKGSSSAT